MPPCRVQQDLCAEHVRRHERARVVDGPVDVRLGREVHDHVVPGQGLPDQLRVTDVTVDEPETGMLRDRRETGHVAAVAEPVQDSHPGAVRPGSSPDSSSLTYWDPINPAPVPA